MHTSKRRGKLAVAGTMQFVLSEEISLLLSLVLHKGRMAIVKQLVESFADELSSLSIGSWSHGVQTVGQDTM